MLVPLTPSGWGKPAVIGRVVAPQIFKPESAEPVNMWLYKRPKRFCRCDEGEGPEMGRVLTSGGPLRTAESQGDGSVREAHLPLLALKVEEGGRDQGMQANTTGWERQRHRFSHKAPRKKHSSDWAEWGYRDLSSETYMLDFWTTEL